MFVGLVVSLGLRDKNHNKQMYIINKCQDLGYETGWFLDGEEVCYTRP